MGLAYVSLIQLQQELWHCALFVVDIFDLLFTLISWSSYGFLLRDYRKNKHSSDPRLSSLLSIFLIFCWSRPHSVYRVAFKRKSIVGAGFVHCVCKLFLSIETSWLSLCFGRYIYYSNNPLLLFWSQMQRQHHLFWNEEKNASVSQ